MERRLIDANAGVELLRRMAINYASIGRLKEAEDYATTANVLNSSACFPTIYAVEVVRCNLCKFYEQETGFCYYYDTGNHWDGFCNHGIRREPDDSKAD